MSLNYLDNNKCNTVKSYKITHERMHQWHKYLCMETPNVRVKTIVGLIPTSISLQVKGFPIKGLHMFLLRTHLDTNEYNMTGLQKPTKATLWENLKSIYERYLVKWFQRLSYKFAMLKAYNSWSGKKSNYRFKSKWWNPQILSQIWH